MEGEIGLHSLSPLSSDKAATFWVVMTSCSHFTLPLNLTNRPHSEVKSRAQHTTCSRTMLHTNICYNHSAQNYIFQGGHPLFQLAEASQGKYNSIKTPTNLVFCKFFNANFWTWTLVCITYISFSGTVTVLYLIHSYGYGQNQSNYTHFLLKRSRSGLEYLSA